MGKIKKIIIGGKTSNDIVNSKKLIVLESEISELETYLAKTDWYAIRSLDGNSVPTDILNQRKLCRKLISDKKEEKSILSSKEKIDN